MDLHSRIETQITEKNGAKFLEVELGGQNYELPFKLIAGRLVGFLDISGQVSLIESAAGELVKRLVAQGAQFDTILNPVSKSNALAHAIALKWTEATGQPLPRTVVARKSSGTAKVQATYRSVTTPKDQALSLTDDDVAFIKGQRLLMVDDVYGGGGTTKALNELARQAEAIVAAHAVVGVEDGVALPEGLTYLFALPVLD